MTDEEIFNILYTAIGRDTVDKFIENADGDLVGHAQVSLEDLAKEIYRKEQEEKERFVKNMQNVLGIEKEQVRKDTAKEILERLLKWKSCVIFDTESVLTAEKNFEDCMKALAKNTV